MTTNLIPPESNVSFKWIDVTNPTEEEITRIAQTYSLHPESVFDCMQPGHLPKYEHFADYTFIILRLYNNSPNTKADTVQELTGKVAIFVSATFIITIHTKPWQHTNNIYQDFVETGKCITPFQVLNIIVMTGLHSFDETGTSISESIDYYEKQVFLTNRKIPLLKGMYFMKRKLEVIRRLLLLTYDIVDKMDAPLTSNAYTRDIRDLYIKQKSLFDSTYENSTHLLNLYFNISSQRTNETMRVLTIFSVFFMPLTFIVGVYGMNFAYMPELRAKYGYPIVMITMAIIIVIIFTWFKRKKWL